MRTLLHCLRILPLILLAVLPLWAADSANPDRVGLPADYAHQLEEIRHTYLPARDKVITVFANPAAASVKAPGQQPYPAGSVIVFQWAEPVKDAAGKVSPDAAGRFAHGAVTRIDVMRHEPGYGADYGKDRAGEWEFASYEADGATMKLPNGPMACARCHQKAGAERDFVFAGRFPLKQ